MHPYSSVCGPNEHRARSSTLGRAERRKWIDPDGIRHFAETETLHVPPGTITIDTTDLDAGEATSVVLDRCGLPGEP